MFTAQRNVALPRPDSASIPSLDRQLAAYAAVHCDSLQSSRPQSWNGHPVAKVVPTFGGNTSESGATVDYYRAAYAAMMLLYCYMMSLSGRVRGYSSFTRLKYGRVCG